MLFGQPCSRCGDVSPAFQRHACKPARPHRPELGPRIPGPGFAMRWVRRPFYLGSQANPTWIATESPFLEATRHLRTPRYIAIECVEHDRRCTLLALTGSRHRQIRPRAASYARKPREYRAMLRAIMRIAVARPA